MSVTSGHGSDRRMMSDINVTPLVDVMLVLLIIFMVTAPMLTAGISVQLPKAGAAPLGEGERAVTVTVDKDGLVYLEKRRFTLDEFRQRAPVILSELGGRPVYIKGDGRIAYGTVIAAMAALKAAGVDRVGLVTEPETEPSRRTR